MNDFNLPKFFNWENLSKKIDTVVDNVAIVPNSTPNVGDVYISLSYRKTYVMLGKVDSAQYTTLNIHLVNPGKQLIGDQLILISQPDTTSDDITYSYDTNFYLTRCAGPVTPPESIFDDGSQERDITIFTYDGSVFCATYDNC